MMGTTDNQTPDLAADMTRILRAMFEGWCNRNNSQAHQGGDFVDSTEWFKEPAGGNLDVARGLELFSYWSNDLLTLAGHFGMAVEYDDQGNWAVLQAPERPGPEYYWDPGDLKWDEGSEDYVWTPGSWRQMQEEDVDGPEAA